MRLPAREACLSYLRRSAFGLDTPASGPFRIGAEVELIPVDAESRQAAPIEDGPRKGTLSALRAVATGKRWTERRSRKSGMPEFHTTSGGRITFEPGGQLEYSSPPSSSVGALVADLTRETAAIGDALAEEGLEPVYAGVDPFNAIDDVPLQIQADRYRRMDAHFATIGRDGARMMRQTASVQINLDLGPDPLGRWTLLNALAPYLAATFANSPRYAGKESGEASVRRRIWGALDPCRTGLPWDDRRPVEAYADFAFGAAAILAAEDGPPFPAFGTLYQDGAPTESAWSDHLTTLFPEVRPRGYFEVRSIDAIDPSRYAAPLVLVAALTHDPGTAREAMALLGIPDPTLLGPAGTAGLAEPRFARMVADLIPLAVQGAASLGRFIEPAELDLARDILDRLTGSGGTPAGRPPAWTGAGPTADRESSRLDFAP